MSDPDRAAPSAGGAHVLIVDDDPTLLKLLGMRLRAEGHHVVEADSGEAAMARLAIELPDLVITDLQMAGADGMSVFAAARSASPSLPVIILTAHGTIPHAVEATLKGVFGYLTKPFEAKVLLAEVDRALRLAAGRTAAGGPDKAWRAHVVSRSAAMEELLAQAALLAAGDASVLVQGETGTGKELLAQAIHRASARRERPFVALNCGAIPEPLLESELFGHVKGAFSGAVRDHKGMLLAADGGTLFLDEIGDMPLALQVKLLRVLQERQVRPLGSVASHPIDVRVISATHRDLQQEVNAGRFREDLYYRLHVVGLRVPPLAERREDIPLLAGHFLARLAGKYPTQVTAFARDAMDLLVSARWPGNVRQLANVVEQTAALSLVPVIPAAAVAKALASVQQEFESLDAARGKFERDYVVQLLKITGGNVTHAARLAQRNRTEFYSLLQRLGIDPALFKSRKDD